MTKSIYLAAAVAALVLNGPACGANYGPLIRQAIERGVASLKKTQAADGSWPYSSGVCGPTALAGLTLLECDVPASDPAVQKAAESVRQAAIRLEHTYSLALSIMFLDRLGDSADVPLIDAMTLRLLAGQRPRGGWDYQCPGPGEPEIRRLTTQLSEREKLESRPPVKRRLDGPRERRTLPKEIGDQFRLISQTPPAGDRDDNSNTQFATLALWVSARHDLPVEAALARVDQRFRATQNLDGGWSYVPTSGTSSTTSMTCAGLLGLAVGQGARAAKLKADQLAQPAKKVPPPHDLGKDPAVRLGLQALGTAVGMPAGRLHPDLLTVNPQFDYYFLWSLERVAVAYGLDTLGKKDWYTWGSELLLLKQAADGSWNSQVDTCFALLFLRRANLAEDLTATLRGTVTDPGEVNLRAGGVGGAALLRIVLKPGDNPHAKNVLTAQASSLAPELAKLVDAVVKAPAQEQAALLTKYQESKGVLYTQALAETIHRVEDPAKRQARDALAERLYRMSAATLRDKLSDADFEVRSAAALACGMKKEMQYVPDLIARLEDSERRVARAAHVALKNITGQDLGPAATATADDRAQAVAAWKAWWKKQSP